MITRRQFLISVLGSLGMAIMAGPAAARGNFFDFIAQPHRRLHRRHAQMGHDAKRHGAKHKHVAHVKHHPRQPAYAGATFVDYASLEKPGTIIIKTHERALYQILGNGKAKRFGVAVGKEGFQWAGVAHVGMKRENPVWTPPPEMIARKPEYKKWAAGMPGGLPINPLGPRAMYLYNKGDTGFRIHGTIHPESIGHAASSGCIRMLNREVIELYSVTRIGTKVIVI
jgi:lipoprotein-anchoring transpeptidase ErfK/SrfK